MHKVLRNIPEIHIDYAFAALSENLSEPEEFLPDDKIALLIAVYLGKTLLIDNSVVDIPSKLNQSNFIEGWSR